MAGPPPGKIVLVVEDNRSTRDIVVHNLNAAGFRTLEAEDGERALEVARTQPIDIILLDVMMPKLDGFSVCSALRQSPATATIPIVIVTARNERDDVVRAVQCGANDYIVKPFTKDTLLTKVEKYVGRATSARRRETKSGAAVRPDTRSGNAERAT